MGKEPRDMFGADDDPFRDPEELAKELYKAINRWLDTRRLGDLVDKIVRLDLLLGLQKATTSSQFLKRLDEAEKQKDSMARYAMDEFFKKEVPEPESVKTIFFESGSTIAYLLGYVARHVRLCCTDDGQKFASRIVTNNMFALTAFADLFERVEPTTGWLTSKYFGFFPFYDIKPESNEGWRHELQKYEELSSTVQECDLIFATCSNFSLLAGPLVGSRANALLKHVLHTARKSSAKVIEMFHFEKLVPVTGGPDTVDVGDQNNVEMILPSEHCSWAFQEPSNIKCADLPEFHAQQETAHHKCLAGEASGRIPVVELGARARQFSVRDPGAQDSWLNWAKGTDILIGLPKGLEKGAAEFLEKEIEGVNQILTKRNVDVEYLSDDILRAVDKGVYHLKTRRR